ncbi:DNA repair exonuclease SbcCD nuclease subunit [Methylocapsa palsarum]|uniref:DNA repair exonuclease SbcCD nuclease subunit n=1 Tax=Methylocapsa palsarum TaxID=1612308 RepID=A0A1I4B568_9HYPH|nr:DNA repair exonuclease SbcCD nuclease subunit [Methylocapsa palsarum]
MALRDPNLAELVGNATRRAFVRIVDLCLDEQVDALILAGDLYDGDQTSMKTARFLSEQIRRLHEAGVFVYVIRGNHDALSRITKELTFPDSVKLFGGRAEAVMAVRSDRDFQVAIHGLSFANPLAPESLISKYKPRIDDAVNIGIAHTSLGGAPGHDPYAPCSVADLQATGFAYWALGHVHKRSVVEGKCAIVMPGMPQGRDINEDGAKSVTLVTIADDRSIRIEERVTSAAQFERLSFDATGVDDWRQLVGALGEALERALAGVASEHWVARVRLTGATPLAWRIRRDLDLLKAEVDDRGSVIGTCWVEKLEVACRPPGAMDSPADDPVTQLRRLIGAEILRSEAYQAEVVDIAEELRAQLPPECRGLFGGDEPAFKAVLAELVKEGAEDVLARLHSSAEGGGPDAS